MEVPMGKIGSFVLACRIYVYPILAIIAFLVVKALLLQKPSTDLVFTIKQENLVDTVAVSGTYQTAMQTSIISPTNGMITVLSVKNGDIVKKGDELFHIESTASEDQQKAAYVAYAAAISTLKADTAQLYSLQSTMYAKWKIYTDLATNSTYQNADSSPNTTNRILTEFTTAQDTWLAAEANYKNQQAVIAKDDAAVASAKLTYDETQSVTVKSPAAGTVVNLQKNRGDQVFAPIAPGADTEPVLVIADLGNPYLFATVAEGYASRVHSGQVASVVFDALKTKTFQGRVVSIDTVGSIVNGVATYKARVAIDDDVSLIKPGMTGLITIETLRKDAVLTAPNSAIIQQDGQTYVREAGSKKRIPVSLGIQGATSTEITGGVSAGTVIVVNP